MPQPGCAGVKPFHRLEILPVATVSGVQNVWIPQPGRDRSLDRPERVVQAIGEDEHAIVQTREDPVEEYWGFDYERLFTPEYAARYGITDPAEPGRTLGLCEAIDRGRLYRKRLGGGMRQAGVLAAALVLWTFRRRLLGRSV